MARALVLLVERSGELVTREELVENDAGERALRLAFAEIAAEVGYEYEAAFKREFGLPPARYRREKKEAGLSTAANSH
jgi:AraC-like DNA-binding protein